MILFKNPQHIWVATLIVILMACEIQKESPLNPNENMKAKSILRNEIKRPKSFTVKDEFNTTKFTFEYKSQSELAKASYSTSSDLYNESYIYNYSYPLIKILRDKSAQTTCKFYYESSDRSKDLITSFTGYFPGDKINPGYSASLRYDADDRLVEHQSKVIISPEVIWNYTYSITYNNNVLEKTQIQNEKNNVAIYQETRNFGYDKKLINPFYGLFFGFEYPLGPFSFFLPMELAYQGEMIEIEERSWGSQKEESKLYLIYQYLETKDNYPIHYKINFVNQKGQSGVLQEIWLEY